MHSMSMPFMVDCVLIWDEVWQTQELVINSKDFCLFGLKTWWNNTKKKIGFEHPHN